MIAIWARRVVERLEKGGVASGPILQAMGIDHRSIGRRGSRLPQSSLLALIEHAAGRLNDPFFGLRLAMSVIHAMPGCSPLSASMS